MQIAMIGLGRMGMNMAKRLLLGGHEVIGYNRSREKTDEWVSAGGTGAYSFAEVVERLRPPRAVWIMLPAGRVIDEYLKEFRELLTSGDIVVDGGNSDYKDGIRRAEILSRQEIHFMDVGVSGGIWGLEKGYCLMVGGDKQIFSRLEPIFQSLSPEEGYLYCGGAGAGHFVKMVHNGIEYGMMEAYAEGFHILESSHYSESLNFNAVAHLWNQGSVIRSWLLELVESVFAKDERLCRIQGQVDDSGEGRWMVREALDTGVSIPVIALSLMQRFRSRERDAFSDKVVAALRREFGGHAVQPVEKG
jgi:6-phosphogluconate dehydrogenase